MGNQPPPTVSLAKSAVGTVFRCVVATPFAAIGTVALYKGAGFVLAPGKLAAGWLELVLGFVFACGGYGLFLITIWDFLGRKQAATLRAAHPKEPWLWRKDWAQGRIIASQKGLIWFGWIFSAVWNALSLTALAGWIKSQPRSWPMFLLVVVFTIFGLLFLRWTIRATRVGIKFGRSTFRMLSVPGVIGAKLEGAIETSVKLRPPEGFNLRLACVNRVQVGSGRSSSIRETVLWHSDQTIKEDLLDESRRSGIPVSFQIPADARESSTDDYSADRIIWRLVAFAKLSGFNYSAIFEVPVFRTTNSALVSSDER